MAIYTRFGSKVELTAYCGKFWRKDRVASMMLVRVRFKDDDSVSHQFVHTLKADGGINEIDQTIDPLPEIKLTGKDRTAALKEAE